jgi:GH24 family phage-related lysozyme (muramidase)
MRNRFNKVCIILIILLFFKIENDKFQKRNKLKYSYTFEENDSLKTYNICIEDLKQREKFMPKVYRCPAGYKTIGYGHKLLKEERYKNIDSTKALDILKEDFNKALAEVNNKFKDSTYNWKLAHAHATFCLGFSRVVKAVKNKDLHKHIFYKKHNHYVKAKSLIEARNFEFALIQKNKYFLGQI